MEIEAQAKRQLADEYDATQERGEIRSNGERSFSAPEKVSGAELISPKALHEARQLRDAEAADPGVWIIATRQPLREQGMSGQAGEYP